MVNYLLRTSIKHEHFTKKYASKKFMRVRVVYPLPPLLLANVCLQASKVTREWFAQRFTPNSSVDLALHVDRLREMSAAQEVDA